MGLRKTGARRAVTYGSDGFRGHSVLVVGRAGSQEKAQFGGWNMLHLIWEAIIGLIVGAIAKFLMPGKDPGGIWITMAIGIAGSIIASFLGRAMGWYAPGESAGFIMSII